MAAEVGGWDETRVRVQRRWPGLPHEAIDDSHGDREALLALLQGRLGYARANAEEDLDEILEGGSVVPRDVADEETHTGTSGPVGPISGATDFATHGNEEVPTMTPNEPISDREPAELPNQPPEVTSIGGGGGAFGTTDERASMGASRTGQDPFASAREAGDGAGMRMAMPKAAMGAVAVGVAALMVGIMMRRKRRSKSEDVTARAKRLLSDISDKMPTVEEVRANVFAIDELRSRKELTGKKLAALARK